MRRALEPCRQICFDTAGPCRMSAIALKHDPARRVALVPRRQRLRPGRVRRREPPASALCYGVGGGRPVVAAQKRYFAEQNASGMAPLYRSKSCGRAQALDASGTLLAVLL